MANRTYHPRGLLVDGQNPRKHPLYYTWANMLSRCYNPSNKSYQNYGGRGISVDPRWHHFAEFAKDMGARPSPELSLERRNNDKGYSKENCEWATGTEQCWNRRTFRNNKSGARGVLKLDNGSFLARFDYEKERHTIGRFDTFEEAATAREAFIGLFFRDRSAALEMLSKETLWRTSTSGVRGVTPHADGGFIARTTVNKERVYLGYFKTIDEAAAAIAKAKRKS